MARYWPQLLLAAALALGPARAGSEALPSWKDGAAKQQILAFVTAVTDANSGHFVAAAERIAVFDNDGTLWSEKPFYFQGLFAIDRVRALAPKHPEWKDDPTFRAVLSDDPKALAGLDLHAFLALVIASHSGMSDAEFAEVVDAWLEGTRHPRFDRRYSSLVYQPMLELLAYLRENGFQTWICSGGGVDFVRRFAGQAYGIPPEQVIGTGVAKTFELRDGVPRFVRQPELLEPVNDGPGKPVWITRQIGRKPILAFGNSDGDKEMLQYTTSGSGASLGLLLRHDDAEREWSYDRDSSVGRLDQALDDAPAKGWVVVSMKDDFASMYPPFEAGE